MGDEKQPSVAERLEKHRRAAADSFLDEQNTRIRVEGPLHLSKDDLGSSSKPSWKSWSPRNTQTESEPATVGSSPQGPAPTPSGLPTASPTPADPIPGSPPTAPGSSNPSAKSNVSGEEFGQGVEIRVIFDESDVDSQLDWQRSRMSSKLAEEQQRVGRRVAEVVRDNLDSEVRLGAIKLVGAKNLRTGFAKTVLEPYLSSLAAKRPPSGADDGTTTLREVLTTAKAVRRHLAGLDIFSEIDSSLEPSPSVLASPDDLDLVFRVKEQGRYFVRTATDVGDGEGSATGTARVRNAFGGAEVVEANVGFGTRTRSSIQFRGEAPINGRPDRKVELSAFVAERDLSHFASCRERLKGGILRFKANSPLGYHELALETTARRICELSPNASVSMRSLAGHSLKSSLSHLFTLDTRDDPFMATRGSYLRYLQEYAGLGGDARYFKVEQDASTSRALGKGYSASIGFKSGILCPLGGSQTHFSDRFHLGGPTSVRMFRLNSLGPKDNGDYLGGELFWAAGASVLAPFPTKPDWPLKLHGFLNAGRLINHESTPSASAQKLFSQPSMSAGVGLMYRHSIVRVELNLGVPLTAHQSDGSRRGLQFGLGLNFLS